MAQAPKTALTPAQVTAFNKAVADFTEGQKLQQAGDNAGAAAKYDAALPAVRAAAQAEPANMDYTSFLANLLYAQAAAQAGAGKTDAIEPLFKDAAPLWAKVIAAKPADAASRNVYGNILVQLGNAALGRQDKAAADPYYRQAVDLGRKAVAENGTDAANRNLLLAGLIGLSQTSTDQAIAKEAVDMSKQMLADGSVDAINKPAAQTLAGAKPAG
jgi:tetratricopeptide (TPR) repeat protein